MQVGQFGFQFDHGMAVAGNIAGAAGAGAEFGHRLLHGPDNRRMLAHAEIIVRAPDGYLGRADAAVIVGNRKAAAIPASSVKTR